MMTATLQSFVGNSILQGTLLFDRNCPRVCLLQRPRGGGEKKSRRESERHKKRRKAEVIKSGTLLRMRGILRSL